VHGCQFVDSHKSTGSGCRPSKKTKNTKQTTKANKQKQENNKPTTKTNKQSKNKTTKKHQQLKSLPAMGIHA